MKSFILSLIVIVAGCTAATTGEPENTHDSDRIKCVNGHMKNDGENTRLYEVKADGKIHTVFVVCSSKYDRSPVTAVKISERQDLSEK